MRAPESSLMSEQRGMRIHVTGVVQGVGFRPFVHGLATRLALTGWVRNTSAGVEIEADGPAHNLAAFVEALREQAPPLARVEAVRVAERAPNGFDRFEIVASQPVPGAFQPISPDVSLCADCRRELFDPDDRRYRYPFINCTHCGPRFTIVRDIPYDRPNTTMAGFALCPECEREYHDPNNRRFHAQPVACPHCGPHVWIESRLAERALLADLPSAIEQARRLLARGHIVAVKGLGGFHLACDATNAEAVAELRRRKLRVDKPFALMMFDLATVERFCEVSEAERALLESRERPIVVLRRRAECEIAPDVAPGQDTLGVMLPYTPLHELLLEPAPDFPPALVMTSGNLSEEPIVTENDDARARLASLADAFLLHNRPIHVRCDDSVVRVVSGQWTESSDPLTTDHYPLPTLFIRRSRGYAPAPLTLPFDVPPMLATGAELKNTFCLARERHAFISHHIGDLENYETLRAFEDGVAHFERLFRVTPQLAAYDLHPNYLATRYALERSERENLPALGVQHHHAHIAACLAENGWTGGRPVIGLAFDGTGYGDDGAIWGGEVLIASYVSYQRVLHLACVPLPGGDRAVREPWRMALAWLAHAGVEWNDDLPPVQHALRSAPSAQLNVLRQQMGSGLNAPPTSSMGRLFDAVAALAGVRSVVNYEAQAAIELEAIADPDEARAYPFEIGELEIDPAPMVRAVAADVRAGVGPRVISARFHNGLAQMALEACRRVRQRMGLNEVALSGGVWQNTMLLRLVTRALQKDGFTVLLHRQVPANDGGLALGQVAVAAHRLGAPGG